MKLIFLILLAIYLNASSYPYFSAKEISTIKKRSGDKAKNRVEEYIKTINYYKYLSKKEQLSKVNSYLNQLLNKNDNVNNKATDYWETPKEFLTIGYGDCEDYAIIKYFTLLKLGFRKSRLFMTIVYDKKIKDHHMVLSYFETRGKAPLILDNLSFKILPLDMREDLKFLHFINEDGTYKMDDNFKLNRVNKVHPKLRSLLQKIKKES